jgi:nucleotide-binding universal stress UspA family protein
MFNRILLAIDDSSSSEVAISFATAMAKESGAAVRVVHVNEYMVGGRGYTVETHAQAMARLESAVVALRGAGIRTEGSLYVANCFGVESRIANAAHDWSADVIVLGSRRRRRFRPFAGRGMRERVLSLTALPVLTAPSPLQIASGPLPGLHELPSERLADFPSISI